MVLLLRTLCMRFLTSSGRCFSILIHPSTMAGPMLKLMTCVKNLGSPFGWKPYGLALVNSRHSTVRPLPWKSQVLSKATATIFGWMLDFRISQLSAHAQVRINWPQKFWKTQGLVAAQAKFSGWWCQDVERTAPLPLTSAEQERRSKSQI